MTDLNTLLSSGSPYLIIAISINDRGDIVGQAFDPNTGLLPAYLATPTERTERTAHGSPKLVLPPQVREMLGKQKVRGFQVAPVSPR